MNVLTMTNRLSLLSQRYLSIPETGADQGFWNGIAYGLWAAYSDGSVRRFSKGVPPLELRLDGLLRFRQILVCPNGNLLLVPSEPQNAVFRLARPQANYGGVLERIPMPSPMRVAVGTDESIWIVTQSGQLMKFPDCRLAGNFVDCISTVSDVSVGADGIIWVVGSKALRGGFEVLWRSQDSRQWSAVPAPAAAIRVADAGNSTAWTINDRGEIWKLHKFGEGNMPDCKLDTSCRNCMRGSAGVAQDIAVGQDGSLWSFHATDGGSVISRVPVAHGGQFISIASANQIVSLAADVHGKAI